MLRPYFHLVVRNWSFTHLLQLSLSYSVYCNYPIVMLQRIRPEMQFVFLEIGWKSTLMLLPSKILWSQIWAHNQLRLTMHKNCISLCLMWKRYSFFLLLLFVNFFQVSLLFDPSNIHSIIHFTLKLIFVCSFFLPLPKWGYNFKTTRKENL